MGVINHNAVVATTWKQDLLDKLQAWIDTLPEKHQELFVFGPKTMNGYQTVTLVPDGSKEGWPESDEGDKLRDAFINLMDKEAYSDGSNSWSYVEVGFGEYGKKLLRGNTKNHYNDAEYALP